MRWWYVLVFQQLLTEDGFKSTGPLTFWGKAAIKLSPKSTRKVTEMAWKTSPRRDVATGMTLISEQLT